MLSTPSSIVTCPLAGVCSGCAWIGRPLSEQLAAKREHLRALFRAQGIDPALLGELPIHTIAPAGLRERLDLVFHDGVFGLYALETRKLLAVTECPALSPALHDWFSELRALPPPIEKGSLRLRIAPDGTRGLWLDFANVDIKRLLEEGSWLGQVARLATVEIGQKRKRLVQREGRWKLDEPELYAWARTFIDDKPQSLYCAIASFTQVGVAANRALVAAAGRAWSASLEGKWVELGAGIGTFTLPLAHAGATVLAVENDALALAGLTRSAQEAGLGECILPTRLSFQQRSASLNKILREARGLFADPPRSGLGQLVTELAEIAEAERPRDLVYVSCYGESFAADTAALLALGYRLASCEGVDQFPQTPHLETVARFQRL